MEKFDTNTVVEELKGKGINVIRADPIENIVTFLFSGKFDEFISTVKAAGENAVLMAEQHFVESDFFYEPDEKIYGEYENPDADGEFSEQIYLPLLEPKIESFREYIGQTSYLRFFLCFRSQVIVFTYETPLYSEFNSLWEQAIELFEEKESGLKLKTEEEQLKQAEEKERKAKECTELLGTLLDDENFIKLPTQRLMQIYATEVFPELKEMDPFDLKNQIQEISDRIKTRKILNK